MHGIHRRVTSSLGGVSRLLTGGPRHLARFPQPLLLLPDCLERLTMLVADLSRFLGRSSELFRLITAVLSPLAHTLCVPQVLLWRDVIVQHGDSLSLDRVSLIQRTRQGSARGVP